MKTLLAQSQHLVDAKESATILQRSRSHIDRFQLQGKLTPVPTIYPRYYYKHQEVIELKKELDSKKANK